MTIQFHGRLIGGAPKDPKLVQGWMRKNLGITDEVELLERTKTHLVEMGVPTPENATFDDIVSASDHLADELKTQGFKRDIDGRPYIESRQIKAGIKESVNILFASQKWGATRKGPKNFVAERVFVTPDVIPVGDDIDGVDLFIGHIKGPRGPQATIGYAEYVEQATISFTIKVLVESLTPTQWANIWSHMEYNGLGAMRSQGYGQFSVLRFADMVSESYPLVSVA